MFDIGSAVVLGFVLTGLVTLVHSLVLGDNPERIKVGICLVASVVTVVLVAASDFAKEQVVLDRPLASLNVASQLVVALLLSGIAAGIWQGLKAVSNVGQNQAQPPVAK